MRQKHCRAAPLFPPSTDVCQSQLCPVLLDQFGEPGPGRILQMGRSFHQYSLAAPASWLLQQKAHQSVSLSPILLI